MAVALDTANVIERAAPAKTGKKTGEKDLRIDEERQTVGRII